jgi:DNA processing protein
MNSPSAPQSPASELHYWLALLRAPGLGPRGATRLLDQGATPRELFDGALTAPLRAAIKTETREYFRQPDWNGVEQDLAWLAASPHNHIITLHDPRYPARLKEIADPPPLLFVHGDADALGAAQLAMVGSRNPTPQGADNAFEFARALAPAGLIITSGLALGVDAQCHRGALAAGGKTIAVTGTGLDRVYPRRHHALAHEIALRGALVSEFPPGTPPLKENFPRRNRIISGLALGTLVVEASVNSGSLITARLAAEQNREVFAIPGSIHNPLARGCHALIRQGAKLVESAADVLEELGAPSSLTETSPEREADAVSENHLAPEQRAVLAQLGFEPTPIDRIIERAGLTADVVSSILLTLELHGHVTSSGAQYYRVDVKGRR